MATFENPDPALPALLNGVLYPSGDTPLWNDAGDLSFNLNFELQSLSPLWPGAEGDLGLSSGGLTLTCPASDGGLCSGHLTLDLLFDDEAAAPAPACAPEDARCALSVNAAFGGADSMTVWGAFDAEFNELHFSAGIPAFPGPVELTDYALDMQFGDGTTMRLGDPLPAVELPVQYSDGTDDCLDDEDQSIECIPMGDLQSVNLDLEVVDGIPFLIATIETAADIPLDRFADYIRFEAVTFVEEDSQFRVVYYDFFPSDGSGAWTIRRFLEDRNGNFNPAALPAGLTFSSAGNVATLRQPLSLSAPRSANFYGIGAYTEGDGQTLAYDSVHDDLTNSTPLLFFIPASEGGADVLPLVSFPRYIDGDSQVHIFGMLPFRPARPAGIHRGAHNRPRSGPNPATRFRRRPERFADERAVEVRAQQLRERRIDRPVPQ